MISCNINTFEVAKLKAQLEGFSTATRARALGRGLDKVAKQGATVAKRSITKEYNIKYGMLEHKIRTSPEKGRPVAVKIVASTAGTGRSKSRIPAILFGAKSAGKKGGVKFKVLRSGAPVHLKYAWIETRRGKKGGGPGVYMHKSKDDSKIVEAMGIDVPVMFAGKRVKPLVLQKINEVGARVVAHELRYELSRLGFKG